MKKLLFLNLEFIENEFYKREELFGLHADSEAEIEPDSDDEWRECEALNPLPLEYDLDTMYEIIDKRDNHGWTLNTLRHKWKKLSNNEASARTQLYRLWHY